MNKDGEPRLRSSAATHVGTVRKRNEDSVVARPEIGLWAVADGAGGHGAGDVASQAVAAALEAIPTGLTAGELLARIRLALAEVHVALQNRAADVGQDRVIATTVVVLLARHGHFACLWAGDSRAYLLRHGVLQRLTRDHSLVQEMVDQGTLTEAEAEAHPQANVILRAIGGNGTLELDKVSGRMVAGDLLLLCSDGLFKAMPEAGLLAMMLAGEAADAIVEDAVARGARDNVSVIAVQVG